MSNFETFNTGHLVPPALVREVKDEQEQVLPGEVHSREWGAVDARCISLGKAETRAALRSLDYKADPLAAVPYFTNGLGLEQCYSKWVVKALSTPNKCTPVTPPVLDALPVVSYNVIKQQMANRVPIFVEGADAQD
jgi:hypothetical protein